MRLSFHGCDGRRSHVYIKKLNKNKGRARQFNSEYGMKPPACRDQTLRGKSRGRPNGAGDPVRAIEGACGDLTSPVWMPIIGYLNRSRDNLFRLQKHCPADVDKKRREMAVLPIGLPFGRKKEM